MRHGMTWACLVLAVALTAPVPADAYHSDAEGHSCPLPPRKVQYHFARGFTPPFDFETQRKGFREACGNKSWRVAGFGGAAFRPVPDEPRIGSRCGTRRRPIVFVHGNVVDAGDWYPVLPLFAKAGYTMCHLWGLSYNGVGSNSGGAVYTRNTKASEERGEAGNSSRITNNSLNVPDLRRFVRRVLDYTNARRFSIVGHSLGVTLARKMLKDTPRLFRKLDTFVGIAGGNHGTTFCRGNEAALASGSGDHLISCRELAPDAAPLWVNRWLRRLNAPDETPGDARYMTIYDGSGAGDPAFYGEDAESPRLEGAINCTFPGAYHNDLRVDATIASVYVAFLARKPLPKVEPGESPATPEGGECRRP